MYSLFRDQWLEKKNSSFSTPKHIIRALTSNFRKKLVLKFIDCLDSIEDTSAKHSSVTILDTILIIYDALNKLAQITIFNCWTCPSQVRLFQYLNLSCPSQTKNSNNVLVMMSCRNMWRTIRRTFLAKCYRRQPKKRR